MTEQLRRGMQPMLAAQIVGHSSLEMVDRVYQHLTVSDAHEALMRSVMAEGRWHPAIGASSPRSAVVGRAISAGPAMPFGGSAELDRLTLRTVPPLPRLSGRELVRALSRLGRVVVVQRGSPPRVKHPYGGARSLSPTRKAGHGLGGGSPISLEGTGV